MRWKKIHISSNNLGRENSNEIFWALRTNVHLKYLDMSDNDMGDILGSEEDEVEGYGIALGEAIKKNSTLNWLDLGDNGLSSAAGVTYAMALTNLSGISTIIFEGNKITSHAIKIMAFKLIKDRRIRHLNMNSNEINGIGGLALGRMLKLNKYLIHLDVGNNAIGDLGPVVGAAFGEALEKNKTLQYLNVENNRIGPSGGKKLALGVKRNSTLIYLNMDNNRLDQTTGRAFIDAFTVNEHLNEFYINEIEIGSENYKVIESMVSER